MANKTTFCCIHFTFQRTIGLENVACKCTASELHRLSPLGFIDDRLELRISVKGQASKKVVQGSDPVHDLLLSPTNSIYYHSGKEYVWPASHVPVDLGFIGWECDLGFLENGSSYHFLSNYPRTTKYSLLVASYVPTLIKSTSDTPTIDFPRVGPQPPYNKWEF